MRKEILMSLGLGLAMTSLAEQKIEIVETTASAVYKEYQASNAIDGVISDKSRWVGGKDEYGKIWLGLQLKEKSSVSGIKLY